MNNDKADFTQGSILKKTDCLYDSGTRRTDSAGGIRRGRSAGGWTVRFDFRPFRCLHRQPGLKPRHLRRNPVRYGYHGFDRPLSR